METGISVTGESSVAKEQEEAEDLSVLEVSIQPTVWDAPVLIGLPSLGSGASAMLCLGMLLNAILQIYICFILITDQKFTDPRPWQEEIEGGAQWRIHVAHDARQVDASGASLASRVCGGDETLSVATSQLQTLAEINTYLGLEPYQLVQKQFGTGPLLCSVCILIFVVIVLRELRSVGTLLRALLILPRGRTRVEDSCIVMLSNTRLLCVIAVSTVRTTVAVVLLYAGVTWLSTTSSITELILNAAALGFVMELDELTYETVVPAAVHTFVKNLKPLSYRRPSRSMDAVLPLLATVVLVALSIGMLVLPNVDDMLAMKRELCGGGLDFVIRENFAGFVVARRTSPYGKKLRDYHAKLQSLAVFELKDVLPGSAIDEMVPEYSVRKYTLEEFDRETDLTISKWATTSPCQDMDTFNGGAVLRAMPAWFTAIREATGLHSGLSIEQQPWTCAEHYKFCQMSALLRLICPVTCGCTSPRSGLLFGQSSEGCPQRCAPAIQDALDVLPCSDDSSGLVWDRYWQEFARFARRLLPHEHAHYEAFVAGKIATGCNGTMRDPLTGCDMCDQRHPFMARRGLRSVAAFCPEQCCHGADQDPMCPTACRRS